MSGAILFLNTTAADAAVGNPTITPQRIPMARHTNMPPRIQKTPYGDVTLTSRWKRDCYYLMAYGTTQAMKWLFPNDEVFEARTHGVRHTFAPSAQPITVERELRKMCAKWQAGWNDRLHEEMEGGSAVSSGSAEIQIITLGQLFDHLYEARKTRVARSTTVKDRYRLDLWRTELGNDQILVHLRPEMIEKALRRIGERTSPSTANTSLGVVKTYLTWASNCGYKPNQSHRTVKFLHELSAHRHHREWWTMEEVALALRVAAEDPHQPTATLLVACGCFLGMRPEEIIMQRWEDLNLDDRDPITNQAKPVCHVVPHSGWQPKDGESRDIPIPESLLPILLQHRQSHGYLLMPESRRHGRPRGSKGWVYRYNPIKVWRRIMKRIQAAGGKAITMYGMRHSYASNMMTVVAKPAKISNWLGHADTRMLHKHYGHLLAYDEEVNLMKLPSTPPASEDLK
jgi:integrase